MENTVALSSSCTRVSACEEKISVIVRVRPLSQDNDSWECVDDGTIVYKPQPCQHFTFDRVFGPETVTEMVYEDGVKTVALSALMGINATIFAYGQASSGKTFTMRGITEKAVDDIYQHIMKTPEKDFRIKISCLEIYNEYVRDLLNSRSGCNLKLLDDPEKGTVVEKLVEKTATNDEHLRKLIRICQAQRQVGETALNDTSSRSHQIIRITIVSTLKETTSNYVESLVSSLNLVDLAGSERVSQTNADGDRRREGCRINLSLMTLTTVIRKLSAGKSSHIPYRDSKLTRILQHSLGGNARTAIICTLSPASSHVEQSRNTLFFATQAKQVTSKARVNKVTSDKQLVEHLQKEVSRLEAELRAATYKNRQMEMEMDELRKFLDELHPNPTVTDVAAAVAVEHPLTMRRAVQLLVNGFEQNHISVKNYLDELHDLVQKLSYQKQLLISRVLTLEKEAAANAAQV